MSISAYNRRRVFITSILFSLLLLCNVVQSFAVFDCDTSSSSTSKARILSRQKHDSNNFRRMKFSSTVLELGYDSCSYSFSSVKKGEKLSDSNNLNLNDKRNYSLSNRNAKIRGVSYIPRGGSDTVKMNMISPAAASLLSGSVAGAVGVGVAFPFDTLKTKFQILGSQAAANMNMMKLIALIWKTEGIGGFFVGVRAMMAGKALIKAVAFWAYVSSLAFLRNNKFASNYMSNVIILILAASWSGFVSSFAVSPVERIKIMMQGKSGSGDDNYANEWECIKAVTRAEGLTGLLGRGLGATIAREVPAYCLNFVVYQLLIDIPLFTQIFRTFSPLIAGAIR